AQAGEREHRINNTICHQCGKPLPATARRHARFCSPAHRAAYHRSSIAAGMARVRFPVAPTRDTLSWHVPAETYGWLAFRHGEFDARQRRGNARTSMSSAPSPLSYVYDGRECLGFVLARGKVGFEALDREEHSLGIFSTQRKAATAIMRRKP